MINKIIISVLTAAEVLTLFPLLFFGLYTLISSGDITQKGTLSMMITMGLGVLYAGVVLVGAFKAIQNIDRPKKAYLFLLLPLPVVLAGYFLKNHF